MKDSGQNMEPSLVAQSPEPGERGEREMLPLVTGILTSALLGNVAVGPIYQSTPEHGTSFKRARSGLGLSCFTEVG